MGYRNALKGYRYNSTTSLTVADPLADPVWDVLLSECPSATVFHTSAWARVLSESYGYRPCYIIRTKNDTITTLVPIMEVKSWLTGTRGVSVPFADYCSSILSDEMEGDQIQSFITRLGNDRKWRFWELRGGDGLVGNAAPSVCYRGHELRLQGDAISLFADLRNSTKRNIRKAEQEGVTVSRSTALSAVEQFYLMHCRTRKKHGLPPQPYKFFKKLHEHMIDRGLGDVFIAQHEGRVIAGAVYLHFGKKVIYKYGASDSTLLHLRPNDLVMWTAIKQYALEGYDRFCFGRTEHDNTGLLQFKGGWGAQEQEIRYYRYDLRQNLYLKNSMEAKGGHNALFRRMPLPVLKLAGVLLYRHLG